MILRQNTTMYIRYIEIYHLEQYEEILLAFLSCLNSCLRSIKFIFNHSTNTIIFQDVNVKKQGNRIITKLYRKPTKKDQGTPKHFL